MSTPTASHPAQPTSASKKAASHVTTPSHLGLSPAPRSIPSPAAARKEQAGKTPINHATASSQGSKTMGGTPMMQTLSQTGFAASPAAQMIAGGGGSSSGHNFGTPLAGLGVDLGGGIGSASGGGGGGGGGGGIGSAGAPGSSSGTPALAALMGTSVSELGRELGMAVGISGGIGGAGSKPGARKRNEDEERRVKMRRVLKSIGRPKGRVSEEGIARVSRRVGLQNDIDAEKLTAEEKERKVGNRTISIAGKLLLVDVELRSHVAQNVHVLFSGNGKGLEEQGLQAGRVLLRDLSLADGVSLHSNLDRFAQNLDWLATADRLSDGVNCFEAISGVYTSLRRLYELEKDAVKGAAGPAAKDRRVESEVMCRKSGRPTIHESGRVGLSLDYWSVDQTPSGGVSDPTLMEVDEQPNEASDPTPHVFRLRVEVEAASAAVYPAIRISDLWLPETFELPVTDADGGIPWQDPPPTYVSGEMPGSQGDSMIIDDAQKLPDLRFVAKLDPPLVVPLQMAVNINTALGITMAQNFQLKHYHSMLLNSTSDGTRPSGTSLEVEQGVLSFANGNETERLHRYTLNVSKPDWGYRLEELPFSHPRQLVDLLPVLRQWAHLGTLLRQIFLSTKRIANAERTKSGIAAINGSEAVDVAKLSLADLTGAAPNGNDSANLALGLTLNTSPQPGFSLTSHRLADTKFANVTVQILPNGEASIPSREVLAADAGADVPSGVEANGLLEPVEAKRLARALNVCNDIGVWIEWMRSRDD